ncbi:purine nucleoside permease [Mycena latifolia]|nr:purine nucleoside permease [Mycena latifolia]
MARRIIIIHLYVRLTIHQFDSEAGVWFNIPEFDILAQNITVPGFSPLYPDVHCTGDGSVCLLTTGQAEINAASTISSLMYSRSFNLTSTYFLYEFDAREIPAQFATGYFPQGSTAPGQLPGWWDGTEVFEVNDALRQKAYSLARTAKLNDTVDAQLARTLYANSTSFAAGAATPDVVLCDTATSDTYWSGDFLGQMVENTTSAFTNGSAYYCTTQQEDNATLNALMRATLFHLVDFSRVIVMRSASDFDRPFSGQSGVVNLLGPAPGFEPSLLNLYLAGVKVVQGIVDEWNSTFAKGIKPTNYIGDVFGTLGGQPDFGPGSLFGGKPARG